MPFGYFAQGAGIFVAPFAGGGNAKVAYRIAVAKVANYLCLDG
jgi:hypothetical protein